MIVWKITNLNSILIKNLHKIWDKGWRAEKVYFKIIIEIRVEKYKNNL